MANVKLAKDARLETKLHSIIGRTCLGYLLFKNDETRGADLDPTYIFVMINFMCQLIQANKRRKWQPTPVFLPGESSVGEGNGNPLQCSCLENPVLEKEMATHSSVLAWRIPGTEEPVGCRLWGHTDLAT